MSCGLCNDVLKITVLINCSLEIFIQCLLNIVDLLSFYLQPHLKGGENLYRWVKGMGIGVRQVEALGTRFILQSSVCQSRQASLKISNLISRL